MVFDRGSRCPGQNKPETYIRRCLHRLVRMVQKARQGYISNPVIAGILNTKYYAVKFDAEGKEPVTFQGRRFENDGSLGKTHQLAYALLQGKLGYPTVVFLTANSELITPVSGYKTPAQIEPMLHYFAGTSWQKQGYDDFLKTFKGMVQ